MVTVIMSSTAPDRQSQAPVLEAILLAALRPWHQRTALRLSMYCPTTFNAPHYDFRHNFYYIP